MSLTAFVDEVSLSFRNKLRPSRPFGRRRLVLTLFRRQLWWRKARYFSIASSTFFGVTLATIALAIQGTASDFRSVFLFAAVACLITGIVNIRQSVRTAAAESRDDYALMLSLGTAPRTIIIMVVVQASLSALAGTVLGLVVGAFSAIPIASALASYGVEDLKHVTMTVTPLMVVVIVLAGVLSAVMAAVRPAFEAIDYGNHVDDGGRFSTATAVTFIIGMGSLILGCCIVMTGRAVGLERSLFASVFILIGYYLMFPTVFKGMVAVLRRLVDWFGGIPMRMAVRSLSYRKTSAVSVASAFTVGIVFLAMVTVIGSWNSEAASGQAAAQYVATLKVNSLATGSSPDRIRDEDIAEWRHEPGVKHVLEVQARQVRLGSTDDATAVYVVKGGDPFTTMVKGHERVHKAWDKNEAIVGSNDARKLGLEKGESLKLGFGGRVYKVKVGAVVDGYVSDGIWVSERVMPVEHVTSAYIITDNPDDMAFVASWRSRYGQDYYGQDRQSRVKSWGVDSLKSLLVEYAAGSLVITTSILGLMTMMSLAVMQRQRELGLLAAYGMSERQEKHMLWTEAMLITGLSSFTSVVVGGLVGAVVGANMVTPGSVPLVLLVWLVVASVIVGLISAITPAIVAVRNGARMLHSE